MADPFVSGAPEAEKDPSDGWTRKGLPAYRVGPRIHSAGIIYFQEGGGEGNKCAMPAWCFTCFTSPSSSPPSIRLLVVEIKKKKEREIRPLVRKIVYIFRIISSCTALDTCCLREKNRFEVDKGDSSKSEYFLVVSLLFILQGKILENIFFTNRILLGGWFKVSKK